MRILKPLPLLILVMVLLPFGSRSNCVGRIVNPVTDICWKCLFPLRIAGIEIASGNQPDTKAPGLQPPCFCPKAGIPMPGIPISFWEPVRLADVTRTPYCMINLGGVLFADTGIKGRGDIEVDTEDQTKHSFYHVHWYMYPIIFWMELLMDILCFEVMSVDEIYLTEWDPFWEDDEKSAILNPEGILFGNMIAQAACAADGIAATFGLPMDRLFWCGGTWGSLYPFAGTVPSHEGAVQASSLILARFMAKLHREGLLWITSGKAALCKKYPMPIIKKSQYRIQMTYPIPQTTSCHPIGKNPFIFQAGKEYPYKGSDFGYLVWRKRDCCML
jgi:conjugal transfer pilus assembly protein TraU